MHNEEIEKQIIRIAEKSQEPDELITKVEQLVLFETTLESPSPTVDKLRKEDKVVNTEFNLSDYGLFWI